jgi:hypothetical protein
MTVPPMVLDLIDYVVRKIETGLGVNLPGNDGPLMAPGTPGAPVPKRDQGVINAGNQHKGGGFNRDWAGSGYPEAIVFKDDQGKLAKGDAFNAPAVGGMYCCGFTFGVVMTVAAERGLLKGKTAAEVVQFQQEWNGAAAGGDRNKTIYYEQCAQALENFGIGQMVGPDPNPKAQPAGLPAAQPGDFMQFWRGKGGHSVIFLDWVRDDDGAVIGIKYRSAQESTDGIGDNVEYFRGNGGAVDPEKIFAGRLDKA